MVERSPLSKKPNVSTGYLTSLYSEKRGVSPNSFWPLLKLLVKGTIWKAIKQSSRQVRKTYELSQCHVTLIIKSQSLGTSTLFSGTSSLSQTFSHKWSSGNIQLYDSYLIGSLLAKRIFSHSCVGSIIRFEPSQPIKTSTKPET